MKIVFENFAKTFSAAADWRTQEKGKWSCGFSDFPRARQRNSLSRFPIEGKEHAETDKNQNHYGDVGRLVTLALVKQIADTVNAH